MPDTDTADGAGLKIGPQDWRYPALRRGYNPRWSATPDYIRLVADRTQARNALAIALSEPAADAYRSRITVRSGGHCYEDFVCSPDVRVIIDASLMNGIYYDPAMAAVCVEAGASVWDLTEKLVKKLGLLLPGGSCNTVGVGGHVTGGGYGLFSRQYGLTVDYLYAVEVAVANADRSVDLVTATRDDTGELGELWWAHTGGGGGNFGMATRFWFRGLPQAPSGFERIEGGWKWSQMGYNDFNRLVTNFGNFFSEHRGTGGRYSAVFGILQLTPSSSDQIGLIAQIDATLPGARARLDEFVAELGRGVGPALEHRTEAAGEHPLLTGSKDAVHVAIADLMSNQPLLNDESGKYKSAYMRSPLPQNQIDAAWWYLTHAPRGVSNAVVQIDSYGAAINAPPRDTAVAQRDSIMKLQHQVYWLHDQDPQLHLEWIRRLYQDMYGDAQGRPGVPVPGEITDGCYINYPDVDLSNPEWNRSNIAWSTLYYKGDYERLRRVKRYWDPGNVFRHEQSVQP
ncbi:BBE domain-containing protein [Streptomonospora sediminis]